VQSIEQERRTFTGTLAIPGFGHSALRSLGVNASPGQVATTARRDSSAAARTAGRLTFGLPSA
jgi:hypothetical protein